MNLKVGRVTPCAPQLAIHPPDGAHERRRSTNPRSPWPRCPVADRGFLLTSAIFVALVSICFGQPIITTQPQNQTNVVGTTAIFWVVATGTEPLACQWQKLSGTWSDLASCTATNLVLTNVQTSHAGDYRVVITNVDGPVISDTAHLTVLVPPRITYTTSLQHQAAHIGSNVSFTVTAFGTAPLSYQWLLDGHNLSGQTSNKLNFGAVQPADEGDYSVLVTNVAGSVTSEPTRLWVVPPSTDMVKGNYTNNASLRLPYFYHVPAGYDPLRRYPLVISMHGGGGDESNIPLFFAAYPSTMVNASYRRQATDPVILVWPTRRAGDGGWTDQYLQQVSGLFDKLLADFSIDTNRVYIGGGSEGVHATWDLVGMRPSFFASVSFGAGWSGVRPPALINEVPTWVFCAADDEAGQLGNTRDLVRALRSAGGRPIYTEYTTGGHYDGILMPGRTPVVADWISAQRRAVATTNEPLISITNPTVQAVLLSGATNLSLAGTAAALGRDVTRVTWTNFANNAKGVASGTNVWSVTNIPLAAGKTNIIAVVATTTSWAPAFGGNTTFNDTLAVIQSPIRATLALQGAESILNWTGGGPPYRVQRATDLAAGDWTDYLTDATPPVSLPLTGQAAFYRIVGQ